MVASWAVVLYVVTVMEYDVNVDVTAAMMTPKLPLWIRADASSEEASIGGSDRLSKKSAVDGAALASNLLTNEIVVRVALASFSLESMNKRFDSRNSLMTSLPERVNTN